MKKNDIIKADLTKKPYRGIYTEIAKEQKCSRQAIWNAIYVHQNPRMLELLREKIKARQKQHKQSRDKKKNLISEIEQLAKAI